MAEKRPVDKFAEDPKSTAGKIKTHRDEEEQRMKEIMSSMPTSDKLKRVQ